MRTRVHVPRCTLESLVPPSSGPVRPAGLELAIDLRTARAPALTIPPSLLARADQISE
jgi:hypothetical protein